MLFVTEGKVLLQEKPIDEMGIIVDRVNEIVQGIVLDIHYNLPDYISVPSVGVQVNPDGFMQKDDIVWFDKRAAIQMPFDKKLFVMDYKDVLLIEREDGKK